MLGTLLTLSLLALVTGCKTAAAPARTSLVATTTMLEDLAAAIAPPSMPVTGLLPIGVDPHRYQPVPRDAQRLAGARVVLVNGLGLEGWIDDLVRNTASGVPVITAGSAVTALGPEGAPDPHIWLDAQRWRQVAQHLHDQLATQALEDTERATLQARHQALDARIVALDAWVRARIASIPAQQRVLVTSHDAFGYFAEAYGIEVHGIQGISTEQEASQRDVATSIALVRERQLPAIFVESAAATGLVEQVARETGVRLLGPLYTDSLGDAASGANTWEGMMIENTRQLVEGLGGVWEEPTLPARLPLAAGNTP